MWPAELPDVVLLAVVRAGKSSGTTAGVVSALRALRALLGGRGADAIDADMPGDFATEEW